MTGEQRGMIPVTTAIALAASLVSGMASYYTQQGNVNAKIAQVREDYVKKQELKEQVQQPLEDVKRTVNDLKTEQALQGQVLKDIKGILDRREAPRDPPR